MGKIDGYKVFNADWSCEEDGESMKQYSCPSTLEEDITPIAGKQGMHFYRLLIHCLIHTNCDPNKKIAEVIAYGEVDQDDRVYCTNKLEIVREMPFEEVCFLADALKETRRNGGMAHRSKGLLVLRWVLIALILFQGWRLITLLLK